MNCSISKGLVIHHGSLECDINYFSTLKVRFWSNIEHVVIIQHLNMLTVIMLTIIIFCIKACNNVQRENNILQNFYPLHRHKIGIRSQIIHKALDTTSYVFHVVWLATMIQDGVGFDRRGVSNWFLNATRRMHF